MDSSGAAESLARSADGVVLGMFEALAGGPLVGLHVLEPDLRRGHFRPGRSVAAELEATRRRWLGRGLSDPQVLSLLRGVATGGEAVHDVGFRLPAGEDGSRSVPLELTVVPLRDADGSLAGLALAVVDRTADEQAERRALLDRAKSGLGDSLSVFQTAQTLTEVAVPTLADAVTVDVLDSVLHGEAPAPGPITEPATVWRAGFAYSGLPMPHPPHEVGSVRLMRRGTPLALALADLEPRVLPFLRADVAWLSRNPNHAEAVRESGVHSLLVVPLAARGVVLGLAVFCRASTPQPFSAEDAELAVELASHAALCLDNARLYTREHTVARIAEHELLPQRLPSSVAVEAVHTHLPGASGATWYDVIRLSGARVALVAGEVRGEGLRAATTMGQLRTAVHAFSALDLDPSELLSRLDRLATRLAFEQAGRPAPSEPVERSADSTLAASCLYVVYDAVNGSCEAAAAAHAPPVLASPDTPPRVLDLVPGAELGRGSGSYSTARHELPPGSVLALYSRGLMGDREEGDVVLAHLLSEQRALPLRTACDNIVSDLLPQELTDDALLLLARTRLLEPGLHISTWVFPDDPRSAKDARRAALEQLTRWGLDDVAPTVELIVTELVTNAVRYAEGEITLRLLRTETLICEVSDSNSAAPHLRIAEDTDEGGRGLYLVGVLGRSWGVRQTERGKTLWVDLALTEAGRPSWT
ncbi:SpoIIE family protein phosphatase [Streptomyces abyssomicinicus]|uniref:SpoIIE family protein phosphatase n=1 Tax=Streptomyces abyssomicinicus TaxID=574929 RepID=UPI001250465A|nr:SpoIIE family protein phosphatase [Streptomyces abyssomicinicus]